MTKITFIFILLSMATFFETSAQEKEYTLVWSDEFDVEGEPSKDWSFESGFVRNEELQWYQSQNAKVKDGCLVIEAKKGFFNNPHYEVGSSDWTKESRVYPIYIK